MDSVRVKLSFHPKNRGEGIPSRSVWFLVDKSLKSVNDVQTKICRRYSISCRRLDLFVAGSIVPHCESAGVFRENDEILVKCVPHCSMFVIDKYSLQFFTQCSMDAIMFVA